MSDDLTKKRQYELGAPTTTLNDILELLVNRSRANSSAYSNDLNSRYKNSAREVYQVYSYLAEAFGAAQDVARKLTEAPNWYMGEVLEGGLVELQSDREISSSQGGRTVFGVNIVNSFDDLSETKYVRRTQRINGDVELKLSINDVCYVFSEYAELSIRKYAERGFEPHTSHLGGISNCIKIYDELLQKTYEANLELRMRTGKKNKTINVAFFKDENPVITPEAISTLLIGLFAYCDEEITRVNKINLGIVSPSDDPRSIVEGGNLAEGIDLITRRLGLELK